MTLDERSASQDGAAHTVGSSALTRVSRQTPKKAWPMSPLNTLSPTREGFDPVWLVAETKTLPRSWHESPEQKKTCSRAPALGQI